MGAVIPISEQVAQQLEAPRPAERVEQLQAYKLDCISRRRAMIEPALEAMKRGATQKKALAEAAKYCDKSVVTLGKYVRAYQRHGAMGLAPEDLGKKRKPYGWEGRSMYLFDQPQRPCYATVAYWLRIEGFASATNSRVRRYLKSLPANASDVSRKRLGAHYYAQNVKPHVVRDTHMLAIGECYEGDGHTCDVYVAHPSGKGHFRPELTIWIDVRSTRVVGWWLGERENGLDVLYALSSAIEQNETHVPTMLHNDPGSGYVNKMFAAEGTGFCDRLAITQITTLPGNARGKGLVEGWFHWFEERCGKRFDTFCGHCRTDDALSHFRDRIKRGEMTLPTFPQYRDAVAAYIAQYNADGKDALEGQSADQLWRDLEVNPMHLPLATLMRPQTTRHVRGWGIRFENRLYRAAELQQYERRNVTVEYDIHDDSRVWIRDAKGRLVCQALLVEKKPWAQASVLEDRRKRSLEGQRKRLQRKIEEVEAQARRPITAAALLDELDRETDSAGHEAPALTEHHAIEPEPAQREPEAKPVSDAELARFRAEVEAEEAVETETSAERWARAKTLEAAAELSEADRQWLEVYQDSSEYRAHSLLVDDEEDSADEADFRGDFSTDYWE
jgi:putative transposase